MTIGDPQVELVTPVVVVVGVMIIVVVVVDVVVVESLPMNIGLKPVKIY